MAGLPGSLGVLLVNGGATFWALKFTFLLSFYNANFT